MLDSVRAADSLQPIDESIAMLKAFIMRIISQKAFVLINGSNLIYLHIGDINAHNMKNLEQFVNMSLRVKLKS